MHHLKKRDALFIIMFAFFVMLMAVYLNRYFTQISTDQERTRYSKEMIVKNEAYLHRFLADGERLIHSINASSIFKDYLFDISPNKSELIDLFSVIVKNDENIMQLRYLNKEGFEEVRVHRLRFGADIEVPSDASLQDKANRYYFKEAKNAKAGQTLYSKLDLNIENERVEIPFNPTVRLSLPLQKEGRFNGLLIINYFMEDILRTVTDISDYDVWIVDSDGYPIVHRQHEQSWQRYKENGLTIEQYFAQTYKEILSSEFLIGDDFVSRRMELPLGDSLTLIMQPNKTKIENQEKQALFRDLWVVLLVLLIIGIVLLITYLYQKVQNQMRISSRFKKEKEALELETKLLSEGYEKLKAKKISLDDENNPFPLISQANVSMTITGPLEEDTPIIYVNDSFTKMTGYSREEMMGKNPRFLQMEDREQKGLEKIRRAMQAEEPVVTIVRNYTKAGRLMYIELSIAPIYDTKTGKLLYFFALQKDVTTEQKILHELKSMF